MLFFPGAVQSDHQECPLVAGCEVQRGVPAHWRASPRRYDQERQVQASCSGDDQDPQVACRKAGWWDMSGKANGDVAAKALIPPRLRPLLLAHSLAWSI